MDEIIEVGDWVQVTETCYPRELKDLLLKHPCQVTDLRINGIAVHIPEFRAPRTTPEGWRLSNIFNSWHKVPAPQKNTPEKRIRGK
jgi:hypothetical protein